MKVCRFLVLLAAVLTASCSSGATSKDDAGFDNYGCAETYDEQLAAVCAQVSSYVKAAGTCAGGKTLRLAYIYSLECAYDAAGRLTGGKYCSDAGPNPCTTFGAYACSSPGALVTCPPSDGGSDG